MIRPYLAVVKDSFREAISSRILPFLLVVFTLLLLAVAPVGLQEETAWELHEAEIASPRQFAATLRRQGRADEPSPGRHIWSMLDDNLKDDITQAVSDKADRDEDGPVSDWELNARLVEELNELLRQPEFYRPAAWQEVSLGDETRRLVEADLDALSDDQLARRNRLLLEAAFPAQVARSPSDSVKVTYLGNEFFLSDMLSTVARGKEDVQTVLQAALAGITNWFVGTFGVFVAILVTANIIPRMFEPGSIDLLLSKPVSRSGLFLTKFFSGCAFIFIVAAYTMFGLFLIVGLRLGVWSGNLLLSIPVFLFKFAILYSISALAGVVWRNAIISVMLAVVVWFFCMGIGFTKNIMDTLRNSDRFAVLVSAEDTVIASDRSGRTFRWDAEANQWEPILSGAGAPGGPMGFHVPLVGLVYDARRDQLITLRQDAAGFGFGAEANRLVIARRDDDWRRSEGAEAPPGVTSLFVDPEGRLVAAGPAGIYRYEADPADAPPADALDEENDGEEDPEDKDGDAPEPFERVGPRGVHGWTRPFAAAMDPASGAIAVFTRGELALLTRNADGGYVVERTADLETDGPAELAFAGETILVALESGELRAFAAESLARNDSLTPIEGTRPKRVVASPNGRWFAVLYHDGRLAIYDAEDQAPLRARVAGQKDISAVAFSADNRLLVADRLTRVSEYELPSFAVERRLPARGSTRDTIYAFVVRPLYLIFPKPGELGNVVSYLFTQEKEQAPPGAENRDSLRAEREVIDIWRPIWTNLVFLTVVLALTCVYVARRDF